MVQRQKLPLMVLECILEAIPFDMRPMGWFRYTYCEKCHVISLFVKRWTRCPYCSAKLPLFESQLPREYVNSKTKRLHLTGRLVRKLKGEYND